MFKHPSANRANGSVFEQLDDPKLAGRKTWKERLGEGLVSLVVSAKVIGILIYALIAVEKGSYPDSSWSLAFTYHRLSWK